MTRRTAARRAAPNVARAPGSARSSIDPRYLIAFLITLVLVVAQLRYHMVGGYERLRRRARRVHGDGGAALLVRPRQGRQPAERVHQRHQPHAAHQAAGRRALAVRDRRLPRDLVEVRAALSRQPSLESDQLRDRRAAARRAGARVGAEPPVRQRPRRRTW